MSENEFTSIFKYDNYMNYMRCDIKKLSSFVNSF